MGTSYLIKKDSNNELEIYTVIVTLLFYLFRTAIPFLKFPFLLLYSLTLIYLVIVFNKRIFPALVRFVRIYYYIIILTSILIISFLLSNKLYLSIFKDVINSIILLSFVLIMTLIVNTKSELDRFVHSLNISIILFALGISFYRLFDLFNIFPSNKAGTLYQIPYTIEVGSIPIDYNFAILPIIFGMISVIYFLMKTDTLFKKLVYSGLLIVYSATIFFAGSRRGMIILIGIIILLSLAQFFTFIKQKNFVKQVALGTRYFLLCLIVLMISCRFFIFHTSYKFKNKTLEFLGTKNLVETKGEIALTVSRYYMVIDQTKSFPAIYSILWTPIFDAADPDSGWGSRMHKTIFPLSGNNVGILPANVKGYYMDRTTNADTLNKNAYSATWISSNTVNENDTLTASVYCYVSKDCDMSMVEICSLGAMGNPGALYDMQNKGIWQKLEFSVKCAKGNAGVLLFFSKSNVSDFSSVNGYLIYAYPQVNFIKGSQSTLSYSGNVHKSLKMDFLKIRKSTFEDQPKTFYNTNPLSRVKYYDYCTLKGETILKHRFYKYNRLSKDFKYFEAGLADINGTMSSLLIYQNGDKDPIRKWASRFISEDTTYYGYKQKLVVDTISNQFVGGRLARWEFGFQIFNKEYNLRKKIFGGGFNYLNWFGYFFLKDKTLSDYPHNPFLSVLLYSGVIGLLIYSLFMVKVFYYYIKYFKEYYLVSIFFLITFFFSFFSAGSPLDPPIMGFFVILPFFIHYVNKNSELSKTLR